jgi:hypothetical protein
MQNYYKFPKFSKKNKEQITIIFDKNNFIESLMPYLKINNVLQDGEFDKVKNIEEVVKNQPNPDPELTQMIESILNRDKLNYDRKARRPDFCESRE